MALPLIYAAGAIVARYIAKKGLVAAAKKFTKKAISEGKKHAKDIATKPTAGQTGTKAGVRGMRNTRQLGRQAALTGAAITAVPAGVGISKYKTAQKEAALLIKNKNAEVSKLRTNLKKARTEKMRIQIQKDIDNAVAAVEVARLKKKATNEAPKTSLRPVANPKRPTRQNRPKARPAK